MNDGILEQIFERMDSVAKVQQGIPRQLENIRNDMSEMRHDMETIAESAAQRAIEKHEATCTPRKGFGPLADRAAENTGVLKTLRDTSNIRRSLAPAARAAHALPLYLKILIPSILAIIGALLGVDLSGIVPPK